MIELDLDKNENQFVEDAVADAVRRAVARTSYCRYPDPEAREVRESIAAVYSLPAGQVYVGNGSDEVLATILHALRPRFPLLYLVDPRFRMYTPLKVRFSYSEVTLPLASLGTGKIDLDARPPGVFLIDSPNAIKGTVASESFLNEILGEKPSVTVLDNCYGDFASDRTLPMAVSDWAIVTRSFSKFYGLAGLRLGYCIAPESVVEMLNRHRDMFNVNAFVQAVAIEVLGRRELFQEAGERMKAVRSDLESGLSECGFQVESTPANFVTCQHQTLEAGWIRDRLAERGVLVRHLSGNCLTENWLRITVPNHKGLQLILHHLSQITQNARGTNVHCS